MSMENNDGARPLTDLRQALQALKDAPRESAEDLPLFDERLDEALTAIDTFLETPSDPWCRDMEKAPKDGTPILGFDGRGFATVRSMEGVEYRGYISRGYWSLCYTGGYAEDSDWEPLAWMPLPAVPTLPVDGGEA